MKLQLKSSNAPIVAMLVVAALAVAFWMLALSPKREEASKLGEQVQQLEASLAQHREEAASAAEARDEFPAKYRQLVVLGKAVPGDDDTASLLVSVNRIAERAGVKFRDLELSGEGGGEGEAPPVATPVSATEAEASLLPLGATIGHAGLAVMPYTLVFDGSFFEVADFIEEIDSMVRTDNQDVTVDGRLVTLDGFSLTADANEGFPQLDATFAVTTYLTPPSQGVTAGATEVAPAAETAAPVAMTTGGAP